MKKMLAFPKSWIEPSKVVNQQISGGCHGSHDFRMMLDLVGSDTNVTQHLGTEVNHQVPRRKRYVAVARGSPRQACPTFGTPGAPARRGGRNRKKIRRCRFFLEDLT